MKISYYIILMLFCAKALYSNDITQITDGDGWQYKISVTHGGELLGDIEIKLYPEIAPKHCHNFDSLVSIKFYDGTAFHRVIPNFMIQGGDPNSKNMPRDTWGKGDPSQTKVPAEFSGEKHLRGILSAARASDLNSATSQFFICVTTCSWLDGKYSIYGEALSGMDIADKIVNVPRDSKDNPLKKVEMTITKISTESVSDKTKTNENVLFIYPQPGNGCLNFKCENSGIFIKSAEISDINGKKYYVKTFPEAVNINELTISSDSLPIGIYIIKLIDTAGKNYNLKFVVS